MLVFNSSQCRSPSYPSAKVSGLFRGTLASPCVRETACPHSGKEQAPRWVSECRVSLGAGAVLQCGSAGGLYEGSRQEGLVLRSRWEDAFPIASLTVCGLLSSLGHTGAPYPPGHLEPEPGSSLPMPGTGSLRLEGARVLPGRSPGMAMAELPCQGLRLLHVRASQLAEGKGVVLRNTFIYCHV